MARRKKKFGAVATRPARGWGARKNAFGSRSLKLTLMAEIKRGPHDYTARVCPKKIGRRGGFRAVAERCGNGRGKSPTSAMREALAEMSRNLK